MTSGAIPYFKMYDASSGKYIKVKTTEDYPWNNNQIYEVEIVTPQSSQSISQIPANETATSYPKHQQLLEMVSKTKSVMYTKKQLESMSVDQLIDISKKHREIRLSRMSLSQRRKILKK